MLSRPFMRLLQAEESGFEPLVPNEQREHEEGLQSFPILPPADTRKRCLGNVLLCCDSKSLKVAWLLFSIYGLLVMNGTLLYGEVASTPRLVSFLKNYPTLVTLFQLTNLAVLSLSTILFPSLKFAFQCRFYSWKWFFYPIYFFIIPFIAHCQLALLYRRQSPTAHENPFLAAIFITRGIALFTLLVSLVALMVYICIKGNERARRAQLDTVVTFRNSGFGADSL